MNNKLNDLLIAYSESHQNSINKMIHIIFVPLIVFSLMCLLWMIPTPDFMTVRSVNFATFAVVLALSYYLYLSIKYFLVMMVFLGVHYKLVSLIENQNNFLSLALSIFIISWIMQFIGHKIEGKKPSFFNDLLFLLIGPVWVIKTLLALKDPEVDLDS